MRRRLPWELAAVPALGVARLLPDTGAGLGLRLAAATACLLLPGALVARALGRRGTSASLSFGLATLFAASAVMFAAHSSLWLALALYGLAGAAALPFSLAGSGGPGGPHGSGGSCNTLQEPSHGPAGRGSSRAGEPQSAERGSHGRTRCLWTRLGTWHLLQEPQRAPEPRGAQSSRLGKALAAAGVLALGIAFGIALWWVALALDGDALFHLARIRKLDAFSSLSLRTVDEFKDGGLHPGYAFPIWHVLLALVGRLGGVDPGLVVRHEATVLTPLAFLAVYEAGVAVFRSAWAGLAALLAQAAITGLAPGNGGSYTSLALPATAARQLLVPAAIALFFEWLETPSWAAAAALACGSLGLVVVHPTYALFVAIPLAGFVVARALLARTDLRRGVAGLVALGVPAGLFTLWLLPIVGETVSHNPTPAQRLRDLRHFKGQIDVSSLHRYRLAPEIFARTGAVAVAALVLVPLAGLAGRRRWAAFVVGGSLVVLGISLIPTLFVHFSDAVSLSQSRRAAGFLPFAFAFAGGAAVLARLLSVLVLPLALAAGIALQLAFPGNFAYGEAGGPALAAWIAAYGGAAALVAGTALAGRRSLEGRPHLAALAAAVFVVPIAADGFGTWSAPPATQRLTSGLVQALRTDVPKGSVVFSDDDTSYRIAAYAPIYVASVLPGHVADTKANRPYERRADARAFFRTGDLAIPRRYGAQFVLVDRRRSRLRLSLPRVYEDVQFVLYRL